MLCAEVPVCMQYNNLLSYYLSMKKSILEWAPSHHTDISQPL